MLCTNTVNNVQNVVIKTCVGYDLRGAKNHVINVKKMQ